MFGHQLGPASTTDALAKETRNLQGQNSDATSIPKPEQTYDAKIGELARANDEIRRA